MLPATVLVALVYIVAGKLGLTLAFVNASATAVWPPTGIALAAVLLFGWRVWPGILVGAFVVNVTTAGTIVSSLGIAGGNTLEALVGAYLVNRLANGRRAFERPQDLFKFVLLAATCATTISATIGVLSLSLTGSAAWNDFGRIWFTWWLGDATGALIVTPLLVLWSMPWAATDERRSVLEGVLLTGALALSGWGVFGGVFPLSAQHYPIAFVTLPVLVWAAVRYGPRGTSAVTFGLSGIAIWGTLRGFGSFARLDPNESLLLVQAYMGVAVVTSLALASSVSQLRRAEDTIRAAEERVRLLHEAQEARAELIREQAARAEAQAAVVARDEFLSVAAHELRTPVTGLLGHVQLARRHLLRSNLPDLPGLGDRLAAIEKQTRRLASLVDRLLDVAALQHERLSIERRASDLTAIVAEVVEEVRVAHPSLSLRVYAADPVPVSVDPARIRQVLVNLLENAIKFAGEDNPTEVDVCGAAGGAALLTVRDHGPGIPSSERERVFERFHQVHGRRHYGGLGLGLYLSREIIALHGGTIRIEDATGAGTRFVVWLPGAEATPTTVAAEPAEKRDGPPTS